MPTCSRCGAKTVGTAKCAACGHPAPTRRVGSPSQDPPGTQGLIPGPWIAPSKIGQRKPATGKPPAERHWLIPPLGDPIELHPSSKALVLGRGEECDHPIGSPTVSRRHAEIVFKGAPRKPWIRDLGTVNGTLVNGVAVTGERALSPGDVVRLGDVTAQYSTSKGVLVRAQKPPADHLNATIPVGRAGGKTLTGFAGDIALFPMPDLIGRLTVQRATGTLVVEVDGLSGHARFKTGELADASFAGHTGSDAVRAIAELARGKLRFDPAR